IEQIFRDLVTDPSDTTPDPDRARADAVRIRAELDRVTANKRHLDEQLTSIDRSPAPGGRLATMASAGRTLRTVRAVVAAALRDINEARTAVAVWLAVVAAATLGWWWYGGAITTVAAWVAAASGPLLVLGRSVRNINRTVMEFTERQRTTLERQREHLTGRITSLRRDLAAVDAVAALGRFLQDRATGTDYD